MTERINDHVSITVEIKEAEGLFGMNQAYVTLFDHNANRVIRTIRGQYILETTTEEEFAEDVINIDLHDLINRYTILAKAYENACPEDKYIIEQWLKYDPQFNDAKWHGDDRK